MTKGVFITVEGGDGSGKSTQIRLLSEYLSLNNIDHKITKEPGGTVGGQLIRSMLLTGDIGRWDDVTETLLFFADRRHHLSKKIWPALKENKWVISDRFADSTKAYQCYGHKGNVSVEMVDKLYDIAVGDFKPDLTIVLDIPVETGLKRSFAKSETMEEKEVRFESLDTSFHENIREAFLDMAKQEPKRFVVVNAEQDIYNVHKDIVKHIEDRLLPDGK